MREIETTAKTVEEAIEIALKELDAGRDEVEIDVVSRGKAGILGLGSEPARVRVTLLEEAPDVVRVTTEVLQNIADGRVVVDDQGNVVDMDLSAEQLLGVTHSGGRGYTSPTSEDVPLRVWLEEQEAAAGTPA